MKNRKKLPILAFDFDGVITPLNGNWKEKPIPYKNMQLISGAKEAINKLYNNYQIVILSSRFNPDVNPKCYDDIAYVEWFLNDRGVKFDSTTAFKPIAYIFVDDCGYKFTTFKKLMHDIEIREQNQWV